MNRGVVALILVLIAVVLGAFILNNQLTARVITSSQTTLCTDSDAAVRDPYTVRGEARLGDTVKSDSCGIWPFASLVLYEQRCVFSEDVQQGRITVERRRCDFGCLDGRCIPYGGSIVVIAKDAQTAAPIANAEVILYSAALDEVVHSTTGLDGSLIIPNERVTFPPTIKKLFREYDIDEPVVFELHTRQYEASAQAAGYGTRVESIQFEEGKDASVEILLEKGESVTRSVLTGKAIFGKETGGDISDLVEPSLDELIPKLIPEVFFTPDPERLDKLPSTRRENADGSITFDYSDILDYSDITRTRSVNKRGTIMEVVSDTQTGVVNTYVTVHGGSVTVTKTKNGELHPDKSYTQETSLDGSTTIKEYLDGSRTDKSLDIEGRTTEIYRNPLGEIHDLEVREADGFISRHMFKQYEGEYDGQIQEETVNREFDRNGGEVWTETKFNGRKRILTDFPDGTSTEEKIDAEGNKEVKYYPYSVMTQNLEKNENISKEEWDSLRERLKQEGKKNIYGEEEQPSSNKNLFTIGYSKLVNFMASSQQTSEGCKYNLADLRMNPTNDPKYGQAFDITGKVKKTAGCTGIFYVTAGTLGVTLDALAHDKYSSFLIGPFTSRELDGGITCATLDAREVHSIDTASADLTLPAAKAAFAYTLQGCSDPTLCPYGTDEQGKQISYCKRYYHTEPCRSITKKDTSCFREVKF